ncbi:GNAT family N-acetyltransferase [Oceanisphaera avium]|uniref:N-acetyltransferase domain-containing protein n=1 Tax=Oceanisphaera avium TaxID=1903694 RepID=A0A1Y0CU75_9GAMM|nr:N-acetyltransferase [Oceanisphaera avium]ART78789.1 hypothetical protein CBP12_00340 [Oceanisphaera avium]
MHVRLATKADLSAIAALEQRAFGEQCYPDFLFRQCLDLWPSLLWVAVKEGVVLGYIVGGSGEQAWVLSLAVANHAQRQGIGKALLNQLLSAFDKLNCPQVRLTVHPNNSAQRLYQACGFEYENEEADYFGEQQPRQVWLRQAK